MYPTISHLIEDLFGIYIPLPIQTFGFWVAIAFLAASYVIKIELQRKEKEGKISIIKIKKIVGLKLKSIDIGIALFSGFLIGFKLIEAILNYEDLVADPQSFILSIRGNLFGGILFAILSLYNKQKENKKQELEKPKEVDQEIHPYELVGNITIIAAVSGIIGAKIFHNLENIQDFLADPIGQIMAFSGLTFYGGLICGAISVVMYCRKYKLNVLHLIDSAAPALMLAYGVGRIGCQMSGDGDWGVVNLTPKPEWLNSFPDWIWSYDFPNNVINAGIYIDGCTGRFCSVLPQPVWPTALYEVIMCIILFSVLWLIRKRITIPGLLFCIYLIMNGIERFFIEKIRVNTEYDILGGITQAEIISFCLIITGLLFSLFLLRKNNISNS
ncbi:MAG: prolipoprotein diacylglyceryl transferase [Flavobacteriales bacterium]